MDRIRWILRLSLDAVSTSVRFPTEPQMTVDAALRLPALRRGAPEVLAGADRLDRPVRWAHSCEARHVPELLEGDEILLMTGMGLGGAAADQRAFVRDLVERRVAGLVIELGRVFRVMPTALVQEARRLHLPLVALHEEVRFVEVTKQLHTAILTRQLAVERRAAELHDQLLRMLVDGAEVPSLLGRLAHAIGNPVLLERAPGGVIFHAAHEANAEDLLADWELLRPRVDAGEPLAATAEVTAAGGRVWGRLVGIPHERPIDALAWSAIARTASLIALALGRSGEESLLESRERGNFLHDVMTGRIAPEDIGVRAGRLGLSTPHPRLVGLVAAHRTGVRDGGRRAPVALRDVREALRSRGIGALLGARRAADDLVVVLALPVGMPRSAGVEHAVAALSAAGLHHPAPTVAAGPLVDSWAALPAGLRAAAETAETMRDGPVRAWHDATRPDVERLLWGLREDERLTAFSRHRLQPLLDHDRVQRSPLLPTLQSLCDHHWQKAPAARTLAIQRQSLYARIGRLQRVLGADLKDPETRLGLELAVRALRAAEA